MERNISELLARLTLEEKASLCSGLTHWFTKAVESQDIPSIVMYDGPHGLRKQEGEEAEEMKTLPATCFPPACGLASSWNVDLVEQVGQTIGQECQAEGVAIVLGPGVNIKRSPLCGRNFEYYSEDPVLSGELGTAWVNGVQSQGVGTSLKHFAANNQETERMSIDAQIDERTLHEIYLPAFELVVKQAQPWTVMCAYNKLNGTLCSEHKGLLTDILREQWGYDGYVISDWGAVDYRVKALEAGLDLQMPDTGGASDQDIVAAVQAGTLQESILDQSVERYLRLLFKALDSRQPEVQLDRQAHHQIAKAAASESIVLLKNQDHLLPLDPAQHKTVAVIGEFAKNPRIQGGGSSHVIPTQLDIPLDEIMKSAEAGVTVQYAPGYDLENDAIQPNLMDEAVALAQSSDVALLFVGLPDSYESEGYDRSHMELPLSHTQLIRAVSAVQSNVVVILTQGSATTISSWNERVSAILLGWLLGQAGGSAIADIVWGKINPSGKLSETLPIKLSDTPAHLNFPGQKGVVTYHEGIFVGYRYYDAKEMEVLYPFGHGLSYTEFEYSDLQVNRSQLSDQETVEVSLSVKNIGNRAGKEIVQLYVKDVECREIRPEKELKAFTKVALAPGEAKPVSFSLGFRDFAYYEDEIHDWRVESGEFEIFVGTSSRDLPLRQTVHVESTHSLPHRFDRHSTMDAILRFSSDPELGNQLVEQFRTALIGAGAEQEHFTTEMLEAMIRYFPIRGLYHWSKGEQTQAAMEAMIQKLNEE